MSLPTSPLTLESESDTARFAQTLAPHLAPGDTLLLSGPIGAGKSAFARALIRARLGDPAAEVPSPTFTLVQIYEAPGVEIWHADLYRLSDPAEIVELGLEEAFGTAICLVEWPERLGRAAPADALCLAFEARPAAHRVTLSGPDRFAPMIGALLA